MKRFTVGQSSKGKSKGKGNEIGRNTMFPKKRGGDVEARAEAPVKPRSPTGVASPFPLAAATQQQRHARSHQVASRKKKSSITTDIGETDSTKQTITTKLGMVPRRRSSAFEGRSGSGSDKRRKRDRSEIRTSARSRSPTTSSVPSLASVGKRLISQNHAVVSLARQLQHDAIRRRILTLTRDSSDEDEQEEEEEDEDEEEEDSDEEEEILMINMEEDESDNAEEEDEVSDDDDDLPPGIVSTKGIFFGLPGTSTSIAGRPPGRISPAPRRTPTVSPKPPQLCPGPFLIGPCTLDPDPTRCVLILDLDETLVAARGPDVIVRPHCLSFLTTARACNCEIILWTAGVHSHTHRSIAAISQVYGDGSWYDEVISRNSRWYKDEFHSGKNLKLLGRSLNRCLFIDNSPCVVVQPSNALLVEDYFGGDEPDHTLKYCESVVKHVVRSLREGYDYCLPPPPGTKNTSRARVAKTATKKSPVGAEPLPPAGVTSTVAGRRNGTPRPQGACTPRQAPLGVISPVLQPLPEPVVAMEEEQGDDSEGENGHHDGTLSISVADALLECDLIMTAPIPSTQVLAVVGGGCKSSKGVSTNSGNVKIRKMHLLVYGAGASGRQYGGLPLEGFQPWGTKQM